MLLIIVLVFINGRLKDDGDFLGNLRLVGLNGNDLVIVLVIRFVCCSFFMLFKLVIVVFSYVVCLIFSMHFHDNLYIIPIISYISIKFISQHFVNPVSTWHSSFPNLYYFFYFYQI
jgi:hypothetical protein